jgi:hypothetical protein
MGVLQMLHLHRARPRGTEEPGLLTERALQIESQRISLPKS